MRSNHTFFSIVVPTYGRPERLSACLQGLARLDYPRDRFEVIVVDDGSEKPPEVVVTAFYDHLDVTLLTQPHAGPATARNTGAAHAKGTVLAFTDDDCVPAADWLQTLAARFSTAPNCAIGGRTLNALPNNPFSSASQLLVDYLYAYYNADSDQARFFASNNLALATDCFQALGGFDTTFPLAAGEDREFCDRWLHHGFRMIYAPEVRVYHTHMLTFRTFWQQQFNYGRGACRFRQIRAQRRQAHMQPKPLAFYLQLLYYPRAKMRGWYGLWLIALLLISQGAITTGLMWERVCGDSR